MSNSPPTEEEIDRMEELYEQEGSFEGVANHDDIDYTRPTVTKWLQRRWEEEDEQEEEQPSMEDNPFSAGPDDEPMPEPEGDYYVEEEPDAEAAEEDFSDILVDEPPEPNEILLEVLESDPNVKEKHKKYVMSKFDQFGQMSPSDVAKTLNDIKIQNKRQTISRVENNYTQRINKMVRDDPEITNYEEWGTLMTKVTGDPSYIQNARGDEEVASGPEIHAPPAAGGQPQQGGSGGVFSPRQPLGSDAQNTHPQMGGQQQPGQPGQFPGQQQPNRNPATSPQVQPPQQDNGLSEFEERLIEMLEQQMTDSTPQPSQQTETQEPKRPVDQLQELVELQDQVKQLQGDDQSADVTEQVEGVVNQLNQRIEQLESKLNDQDDQRTRVPQTTGDSGSGLSEIVHLSQQVDDPQIIQTLIEMQTDPDVLEAKAKREEIENESAWKKSLAESLSPAAAEQAVSAFASLAKNISPPPAQQQAQQAQQQPQQAQQPQQNGRGVEVVEDSPQQAGQAVQQRRETAEASGSPLREEGRAEAEEEAAAAAEEDPAEEPATVEEDDETVEE